MGYALQRKDYEELVVLGHGETYLGVRLEDAPAEDQRKWLDGEYPKSTEQGVLELRARGLDATGAVIEYLIRKGEIKPPGGEGRNRKWSRADIDRLADYLDERQVYVPGTAARAFYNIDPAQDMRALRKAFRDNPEIPPNPDLLVMEIKPGAAGLGIRATVSYRAMTRDEQAEWRRKVSAAQRAEGKRD